MMPNGEGIFASWGVGRKQSIANLKNNWGGVFQSNSWSTGSSDSSYSSVSRQNDEAVSEYDVTMLYASGNGGDDGTVTQDASAKNVIAVGALNHYDNQDRTDDQHTGGQGNKGPTDDGRIKPDVVGPYDSIYTTTSGGGYTSSFGGTSGATPVVAGGVGLIYEMYKENHFGNNPQGMTPHASTVKAILIADAYQYEFTQGDRYAQGWGLVDVGNVYNLSVNHFIDDENSALRMGDLVTYKITPTMETPLKITLVWTDVPTTTSSSMHLINDLNLKVIDPNGEIYHGNYGLVDGKWSEADGEMDHTNNVENVFIENPISGEWTIEVFAENVPRDGVVGTPDIDQSFALVASGVVKDEHDLRVESLHYPRYVDTQETVQINASILNIGSNDESNVKVRFYVDSILMDSFTVNSIGYGDIEDVNFVWTPTNAKKYDISVDIEPISQETSTVDNRMNVEIEASIPVGRILVDDGHDTDWRHSIYYRFIEDMRPDIYRVFHTNQPITNELLSDYDVFISAWPTQSYSAGEVSAIQSFVDSGGGLLVIGESEQSIYDDITDYAGISWGSTYMVLFTGETSELNSHEITENVDTLYFDSHQLPLSVSGSAEEIVYTYDGMTYSRVVVAASEYGGGKVVAIADEECLNSEYIYEFDNIIFGQNIIRWLTNERPISIIDSPLDGGIYNPDESILFEGSSSYDPDGDALNYLWTSDIDGEIGSSASFSTNLTLEQHTITLEVTDSAGKIGISEVTISIQSPPEVAILSPDDGILLNGVITMSGTALDSDGVLEQVEVKIDEDMWQIASDSSGSGDWSTWTYSWDSSLGSDGEYTISVRSQDNDLLYSIVKTITVTTDNTPPEIITDPQVRSITHLEATIDWETDEDSDSKIEYWEMGSTDIQSENDSSLVSFHSIDLIDLQPSTSYYFTVESKDEIGNSVTSQEGTFTTDDPPDFTPPTAEITSPDDADTVSGTVLIKVDASDNVDVDRVDFYIDDVLKYTDENPGYSWLWDTETGHYPDDEYSIKVIARDPSNNIGIDEIVVTLDNEVIAPTIVDTTVSPNTVTAGEFDDVLFTIEMNDPESAIESVEIDLSPLGDSSDQTMYDDGTRGDLSAGDNIYSYETTISSTVTSGEKSLEITVTYREGEIIETFVELTVTEPPDGGDGSDGSGSGDGSDGSDGGDGSDGSDGDDGSSAPKDEREEIPWIFVLLIPILGIIIVSLVYIASRRGRTKNVKQAQPQPQYQTGYYQEPVGYDQTPQYRQ
jgi:hypothetical protein